MPKRKKSTDLYKVSLSGPSKHKGESEILKTVFISSGIDKNAIAESDNGLLFNIATYCKTKRKARALKKKLLQFKLKKVSVKLETLKQSDWRHKWKDTFHTFALTKNIDVVPVWERKKYKKKRREPIFIRPGNVFGTGLHETTKFTADLIEKCSGRFESFLDIGTGTGILALVALKCHAYHITAIDMDHECAKSAKENLSLNGYNGSRVLAVNVGCLKTKKKFDFVAANLITQDLIRLKRKICSLVKPGKYLAVSGVSLENLQIFKKAYRDLPLRTIRIKKGWQWAAFLFKRKK